FFHEFRPNSSSLPEDPIEEAKVSLHCRTEEVRGAIGILGRRRDQAMLPEEFEMMQDRPIVQGEGLRELIRVEGAISQGRQKPRTVSQSRRFAPGASGQTAFLMEGCVP